MLVEQSLRKAIRLCGKKQITLAKAIGEKPDNIRYWLNTGNKVPFHKAIAIEIATNGQVSRFDLAPYARFKNSRVHDHEIQDLVQASKISISERVIAGVAYEEATGSRQGARTDLSPGINLTQVKGKTTALAAKHAGFNSRSTYLSAKKVISRGIFKLVQAMDEKIISIFVAASIAEQKPEEQEIILSQDRKQIIKIAKQLRADKKKKLKNEVAHAKVVI